MNKLPDRLICYSYPEVINNAIQEFVNIVERRFRGQKTGVLLIGSASRGELCWGGSITEPVVFSDIEFFISVDNVSSAQYSLLSEDVEHAFSGLNLGERFHFDYTVIKWHDLPRLDKRIIVFDSKTCGIDLTHNSICDLLPEVTSESLDFHELNDVLLHRMKAIVNDIPSGMFNGNMDFTSFVLSIAKNTLDITTWLFPYEADQLVSGFENRLKIWQIKRSELKLTDYFDESDYEFLDDCLSIRKKPLEKYDVKSMLVKYIKIYKRAIEYCKSMNGVSEESDIGDHNISKQLFLEYKLKRRIKEAYLIALNIRTIGPNNVLKLVFMSRKGRQVEFCFEMIEALTKFMNEIESSNAGDLVKSKYKLSKLMKVCISNNKSFNDEWLFLRKQYRLLNKVII